MRRGRAPRGGSRARGLCLCLLWVVAWGCGPTPPPAHPVPGLSVRPSPAVALARAEAGLQRPEVGERVAAARALGGLPPSPRMVAALRGAFQDPSPLVVAAAALSAQEARALEARDDLRAALSHPAAEVRALACDAAAALGLTDPDTVAALTARLIDPDPAARRAAASALGALEVIEAAPALAGLLDDKSPEVVAAAVAALGPWAASSQVALLALLERAAEGPYALRVDAIQALGRAPSPATTYALLQVILTEQPDLRRVALSALESLRDPASVEPLLGLLRPDARDSGFSAQAVFSLGQIGDPRAIEPLLAWAARQPDWWPVASSALAAIGGPAVEPITRALRVAPDAASARALVSLLGRIPTAEAAAWLGESLDARRYPTPWLVDALTLHGLSPDAPPLPPVAVGALLRALPAIDDAALAALLDAHSARLDDRWLLPVLDRLPAPDAWASLPAPLRRALLRGWAHAPTPQQAPSPDASPRLRAFLAAAARPDQPDEHRALAVAAAARRLDPADALALLLSIDDAPNLYGETSSALASLQTPEALAALLDRCEAARDLFDLDDAAPSAPSARDAATARAHDCAAVARALHTLPIAAAPAALAARADAFARDALPLGAATGWVSALPDAALSVLVTLRAPDLAAVWRDQWALASPTHRVALLRAAIQAPNLANPPQDAVRAALQDPSPDARAEAAWLLGLLPNAAAWQPPITDALTDALADPYPAVRANAAASLGRLPAAATSDAARAGLWRHLLSPHPMVQANAAWALTRLDPDGLRALSTRDQAILRARAQHPFAQDAVARALGLPPALVDDPYAPPPDDWFLLTLTPHADAAKDADARPVAHVNAPLSLRLPDGSVRATTSDQLGQALLLLPSPGRVHVAAGFPAAP